MSPNQFITVQRNQGVMVAHLLVPRMTASWVVQRALSELARMIWVHRPQHVLVNFGQVTAMSSELVGKLQELALRQQRRGGWLKLCGLSSTLREPFRILVQRDTMDICDSASQALDRAPASQDSGERSTIPRQCQPSSRQQRKHGHLRGIIRCISANSAFGSS